MPQEICGGRAPRSRCCGSPRAGSTSPRRHRHLHANTTNRLSRGALLPAVTQVAIADGNLVMATAAVAELEELAADYANPEHAATAMSTRGRLQLALGEPGDARATLQRAVALWQRLAVPYEVATTWTLLGEAYEQAGDEHAATESFATAVGAFDRIGAGSTRSDSPTVRRRRRCRTG